MMQITPHEQYQLVTFNWAEINENSIENYKKQIKDALEVEPSLIVNVNTLENLNENIQNIFSEINSQIQTANGHLVFCEGSNEINKKIDEMGLVFIPSLDEAVDYIFMEQIEKMMGEEDEN